MTGNSAEAYFSSTLDIVTLPLTILYSILLYSILFIIFIYLNKKCYVHGARLTGTCHSTYIALLLIASIVLICRF